MCFLNFTQLIIDTYLWVYEEDEEEEEKEKLRICFDPLKWILFNISTPLMPFSFYLFLYGSRKDDFLPLIYCCICTSSYLISQGFMKIREQNNNYNEG